jgi:sulfonate transport system permease protein
MSGYVSASALPAAVNRSGGRFIPATLLRRLAVPFAIIAVWYGITAYGYVDSQTMPTPQAVAESFWMLAVTNQLVPNLLISLQRVAIGLAFGVTIGTALALAASLSRAGEDAIDGTVQMARTLPHLALIPLMILWFGIGETPKIVLIALGSVFPIYLNLFSAVRGADRKLLESASVLGLSHAQTIWHVILPAALPGFLVGLRQAFGFSWLSLVVAEQINASSGIGYLVMNARDFLRTDIIFDGLIIYALLGLATDQAVRFLERHLLVWRPSIIPAKRA